VKNRIYAIKTVKGNHWVYFEGLDKYGRPKWSNAIFNDDLTWPLLRFKEGEEITKSPQQAGQWAKSATRSLGVECVAVAIDLVEGK